MKYSFLRIENNKKIVFDWKRALEFEGETGPYLQYSAVRSKRILEKAKKKPKFSRIEKDIEYQLIRKLYEFGDVISDASKRYAPHIVANYTMDIAKTFSEFYSRCKVVGSEYEASRLAVVRAYHQTISKCLYLLGIEIPERM